MNYSGDQLLARLRDYNNYPETESEYLDGRYFGLVLGHFPGVNVKPIKIKFAKNSRGINAEGLLFRDDYVNIFRVIIEAPDIKHALLLFVDLRKRKIEVLNFIEYDVPEGSFDNVMRLLISSIVPENSNYDIDYNKVHVPYKGMCNAYNIKEVLDRITKEKYDPDYDIADINIRKFARAVEEIYEKHLTGNPDIEYGFFVPGTGLGLGLLGGFALGAAATAPYRYAPRYGYPYYY